MANHVGRAAVEEALRARRLDSTLTTALPPPQRDPAAAPTGVGCVDTHLGGGVPRGQLSEIAGARSSGRTSLLLQCLAAATRRGEIAALVDAFDCLDAESAVAAGISLDRLLWIRGQATPPALLVDHVIERAVKALNLVLQAGGFGIVALDIADAPPAALNRIPFTTWLRIQRTIEGRDTSCVLVTPHPLARSAGGLTLSVAGRPEWDMRGHTGPYSRPGPVGPGCRCRRLAGLDLTVRVMSPRRRVDGDVTLAARTDTAQ